MKKKFILKFWTGTAFNIIMGVILASMVGISPAYGAASGIVVPMLLKGFMPAGAAMRVCTPKYGRGSWSDSSTRD